MILKLAKREEQIMNAFWQIGKGFIRDIIALLPDPKPHYNSVATIVKILEDKGFLTHEIVGNMHYYMPLITKEEFQKYELKDIASRFFDNSYSRMLAFFAKEQNLTSEEVKEMLKIIKSEKK